MNVSLFKRLALVGILTFISSNVTADDAAPRKVNLDRVCFFDTRSSGAKLHLFESDKVKVTTLECAKGNPLQVIKLWIHDLGGWSLTKKKFTGSRKILMGKLLEKALVGTKTYQGKILVDEYLTGATFVIRLTTINELSPLISYLVLEGIQPNRKKNFLFITTEDGSDLTNLTEDEQAFITSNFVVSDAEQYRDMIKESFKITIETCTNVNNSSGVVPFDGDSFAETSLMLIESKCFNFDPKIFGPIMIKSLIAGAIIYKGLDQLATRTASKVHDPIKTTSNNFIKYLKTLF